MVVAPGARTDIFGAVLVACAHCRAVQLSLVSTFTAVVDLVGDVAGAHRDGLGVCGVVIYHVHHCVAVRFAVDGALA